MRAQNQLMWLAHVLPAVALTITTPVSGCGVNLIRDASLETLDTEDSVWTVLPPVGRSSEDGYLHLSPEAVESNALLVQTVSGVVAEEKYTISFDYRQTALEIDGTAACTVGIVLGGEDSSIITPTAGAWTTVSTQWTAPHSPEVDVFVVINCPGATDSGTTVDVKNFSLEKPCGPSSTPTVSPTNTPSASVTTSPSASASTTGDTSVSSASTTGHTSASVSSSSTTSAATTSVSSHSSSIHVSPTSPSSTPGPVTLTTTTPGPVNTVSSSATDSLATTSGAPGSTGTKASTTGAPSQTLTTSTIYTTRTSTITACPTTVPHCPADQQTTYTTTETIVVSTTVCPVDATTTADGPSPTGPSGGNGSDPGNGNDYTISTIHSTRTVTLTECPASVTDCPARDQTTHVTTETVVAGTTSVPIHPVATTTAPGVEPTTGAVQTGVSPTQGGSGSGNGAGVDANLPGVTDISSSVPAASPTDSSNPATTSPVFNGGSSFAVSGAVSALGALAALALFL
ncbi:hypothetical protein N7535_000855 [Penicillium sp. DV-2018c]|nr:hypothetical protein N7461_005900 [Penicillium sp. DV-2018c]KAJ5582235.1 hypothetical protein N7535_000855 [Penicillium sp. DV-2018c]